MKFQASRRTKVSVLLVICWLLLPVSAQADTLSPEVAAILSFARLANDAPAFTSQPVETVQEDSVYLYQITTADPDVGDTLRILAPLRPAWLTFVDNGDGSAALSGQPGNDDVGSAPVRLEVSDAAGASITQTFTLTVQPVNDPPAISPIVDQTLAEDRTRGPVPFGLTDPDTDLDALTLFVASSNPWLLPPQNVAFGGSGANRTLILAPVANEHGAADLTIWVSDGEHVASTDFTVTVTPVNDRPSALELDYTTVVENAPVGTVIGTFYPSDPDAGDTHTITLAAGTGGPDNHHFTIEDRQLKTATVFDYETWDEYAIRTQTTDVGGLTYIEFFTITVTGENDPPVAIGDFTTTTSDSIVFIPVLDNDFDPEGDALSLLYWTEPDHGVLFFDGWDLSYLPDPDWFGLTSFSYVIDDGFGGQATAEVTLLVNPSTQPDLQVRDDRIITLEDTPVMIPVLQNDTAPTTLTLAYAGEAFGGVPEIRDTHLWFTPTLNYNGVADLTYAAFDASVGGGSAVVTVTILPIDDRPIAQPDSATTTSGQPVNIWLLDNDYDVDDSDLALVNLGQGQHGLVTQVGLEQVRYLPDPAFVGWDAFAYEVTDGQNVVSSTVYVEVLPAARRPNAVEDVIIADEDVPVTVDVLTNDSDPNLADGIQVVAVTSPQHGVATLLSSGLVHYASASQYHGPDHFTYQIQDSTGLTATGAVSITVRPVNDLPAANPVFAQTAMSQTLSGIDVFKNSANPDGVALQIADHTQPSTGTLMLQPDGTFDYTPPPGYQGTVTFTYALAPTATQLTTRDLLATQVQRTNKVTLQVGDAGDYMWPEPATATTGENTPVTLRPLDNVQGDIGALLLVGVQRRQGLLQTTTDGTVTYTPPSDFSGTEVITYTARDSEGGLVNGTLTVTVEAGNHSPAAVSDVVIVQEDTPLMIDVLANDSDRDGDAFTITQVLPAHHGVARLAAGGAISYTPQSNFAGTDSFAYVVEDTPGAISYGVVTLNVLGVNDAPLARDDWAFTPEDTRLFVDVLENDTELDGDWLQVRAGTPQHGEVLVTPVGSLNYLPNPEFSGLDVFTYTTWDARGASAQAILTVTVGFFNDPPIAPNLTFTTTLGVELEMDVLAHVTDVDSDIFWLSAAEGGTGALQIAQNRIFYSPSNSGVHTLSYTVTDDRGAGAVGTIKVLIQPYRSFLPLVLRQ